ncbi:TetR/AcrR family transcriptional regulator [Pedococcus sp. NPDC057267]|uniref:TetR/AcrR family transcriptional regulator n=1 Tax=Pedococcus sp. NPDC057267 TaxID=3346077 RepID=UPI003634B2FC
MTQTVEHTRERLLQAALRRFSERGFAATTVKQIAADVGLKAPAIYNHYASKEELLVAASTWALDAFQNYVLGQDDPSQGDVERLEGLVRRHVLYQLTNLEVARANDLVLDEVTMQESLPPEMSRDIRGRMRVHLDLLTTLTSSVIGSSAYPDARTTALAITTLCDRVNVWYRPGGPSSADEVADAYWVLAKRLLAI